MPCGPSPRTLTVRRRGGFVQDTGTFTLQVESFSRQQLSSLEKSRVLVVGCDRGLGVDGDAPNSEEIPAIAVRELVASALVHRDLSAHCQTKRVELRLTDAR